MSHACSTCGGTGVAGHYEHVDQATGEHLGNQDIPCLDCIEGYPKAAVERAEAKVMELICNEIEMPHSARSRDYLDPESKGEARRRQLEMLRAADEEADQRNRELIRRVALAAIRAFHADEEYQA